MLISDLPTPTLLVDRDRVISNVSAIQERADREGVALRPHIKTHKSPDLARLQVDCGATGITAATVSEAEAFSRAGFEDILIAREVVDEQSFRRIDQLRENGTGVAFCIDSLAGARAASGFFSATKNAIDILIEVDTGHGRCGIEWDEPDAENFVQEISTLGGLNLRGLLTHGGQGYFGPTDTESKVEALQRAMTEERDRLLMLAERLGTVGLFTQTETTLSVGSTPTFSQFENAERAGFRITEVRPGNYVVHDALQVALGVCSLQECALTVLSRVTSIRRGNGVDKVFIDAGKKVLTTDQGYGTEGFGIILHSPRTMRRMPHARLNSLSEEHGWIEIPGGAPFDVGDTVRVVPNHACVAVATQSRLCLVDGESVLDEWTLATR